MANTKSAKKAILVNKRNRDRNFHFKSRMRSAVKAALNAINTVDSEKETIVRKALQIIDQTAAKGVIKKGAAARKKSRLSKSLLKGPEVAPKVAEKPSKKKTATAPTKKPTATKKSTPKAEVSKESKAESKTETKKKPATKKASSSAKK